MDLPVKLKEATLYYNALFGFAKKEIKDVTISKGKYAQYNAAIRIVGTEKGKRKQTADIIKNDAIVLVGWKHPDPPDAYKDLPPIGNQPRRGSKYAGGDPRYRKEFDKFIDVYLKKSKVEFLDLRNHDPEPHRVEREATRSEWETVIKEMREEIGRELTGLVNEVDDAAAQSLIAQKKIALDKVLDGYIKRFADLYPKKDPS